MGIIAKQLLKKEELRFRINLEKERLFGQYPVSLTLLKSTALASLEEIEDTLRSKLAEIIGSLDINIDLDDLRQLKAFIKNNPRLNQLLKKANDTLDEEIIADVIKKCANIDNEIAEEFNVYELYSETTDKIIKETNDILSKVGNFLNKAGDFLQGVGEEAEKLMRYAEMGLMAFYIIKLIINLFQNTDFPSLFRIKFIQKLIRYTLAAILDYTGEKFEQIKDFLKTVDALTIAFSIAGALYLYNRRLSQKSAKDLMLDNACDKIKEDYINAEEQSILDLQNETPGETLEIFGDNLTCPIPDTDFVPKEPFANKLETFQCELKDQGAQEDAEIESVLKLDTALKAKVVNRREDKLTVSVKKEQKVDTQTILGEISGTPVYSPVNGMIESFTENEIVLKGISDPSTDVIISEANKLNSKYQELYEIKSILKDYEITCLYPIMLKESPVTDGSTSASEREKILYENMENQFEKIRDKWFGTKTSKGLLEDYEKRVEKITSEKNVQKHADNETTYKIKEELDKEDNKLYSYLLKVDDDARNIARQTEAKNGEYELLEYYINNLVLELNEGALQDDEQQKQKYLPSFRNEVNKFVRQRYVIEGWKPKKISDKAIELLKDLERGATNGSKLWKEGLEKYNERKKLSDVRFWLENSIKPRRKLEDNEVEDLIDRIFFLYQFYLDIKAFTKDYKDLKESSTRQQTEKEGNYLNDFFTNLQVRYREIPSEIAEIEKKLEDLSILSIFFNQIIKGVEYRIYNINPLEDTCNSSYAKDAKSEYSFGDIQYWLKWCGFATLTGLVPLYWSTGLFAPGPITLPVVYIPIKPIQTKWGFILIGLTVTGIYPFPMLLFGNLSSEYTSLIPLPFIDLIKNAIEKLKEEISEKLSNFKSELLQKKLDEYTEDILDLNSKVKEKKKELRAHKIDRPSKSRNSISEYTEWTTKKVEIQSEQTQLELERWKLEKKHQIISSAINAGSPIGDTGDTSLKKLEDAEKVITDKLDLLIEQTDKIDTLLAPLPTTLQPYTADFGITFKNPKPVIEIQDKLNENINNSVLDKILENFKLSNEGFMTGPVEFNKTLYDTTLKAARFLPVGSPVSKDPFPKYQDISPINPQYLKFLTTEFLPKGAQTYGIPGQLPVPVG